MVIVSAPFTVKYHGHFYMPNETFEADDADLDKLTAIGAKADETSRNLTKTGPPGHPGKPVGQSSKSSRPYKIPSPKKRG